MSYAATLRQFWERHLETEDSSELTALSLFAGCGGSSLGMSAAGFGERLAVERDPHACAQLRLNFPVVSVHEGDIAKLSVAAALDRAMVKPRELDLFDGSPPCQGFSTSNTRGVTSRGAVAVDERNSLFREYVRLLRGFMPRAFVMENVPQLAQGKTRAVFREILAELKASGYVVKAWPLSALHYGVPQARTRLIFIGFRSDLGIVPVVPRPVVSRAVTLGAAWEGLDIPEGERLALIADGKGRKMLRRYWQSLKPGQIVSQLHNEARRKNKTGGEGASLFGFSYGKVSLLKPMNTIGTTWACYFHPKERRTLTIGELTRAQSFPDEYQWQGKHAQVKKRIGNSVPPLMAYAVAQSIRSQLDRV